MDKTLREKIALIVFALLVVITGFVLIGYFSTGRSWTIAATFVDDTVGEMDGYSVILFNGITDESDDAVLNAAGSGIESGDSDDSDDTSSSDVSGDQAVGNLLDPEYSIGLRILAMYPRILNGIYDGVFVSDVCDIYARKGASVVALSLTNLEHYEDPYVIKSGTKRIGIYSLDSYKTKAHLKNIKQDFDEQGADAVVCITPRLSYISDFDSIDIVILTTSIDENSKYYQDKMGDTFVVLSPEKGSVGIIVLSSNNVPTYRVIEAL